MSTQTRSGFTIIEVMLFLAITSALTIAILVGSGAAISRQRYNDSVNSFKGLIQEQYSQIANVINTAPRNPICTPSGDTLSFNGGSEQPRGTSQCLIIGRFLLVEPTEVTAYNVIGQPPADSTAGSSDSATLKTYAVAVQSPETHEISWGARIVPKTGEGETTGILIVRSPLSGSILTYIKDMGDFKLSKIREEDRLSIVGGRIPEAINDGNMVPKDFCIDSSGSLSSLAHRRAVHIKARAASQSAIEIPLESESVCD